MHICAKFHWKCLQMSHTILGLQKFRYVKIKCYRLHKYIRVNTHILAHTYAHKWNYNSDNTHTPPHLTPASSEWLQLCTPTELWPHSSKVLSLPAHLSSSRRMDPEPLLNTPPRTGIEPATSNHSYCLLTINQFSLRSKHAMHSTFAQSPGECCYPTDLQLLKTSQSANSGYTTCLMAMYMTHPLFPWRIVFIQLLCYNYVWTVSNTHLINLILFGNWILT